MATITGSKKNEILIFDSIFFRNICNKINHWLFSDCCNHLLIIVITLTLNCNINSCVSLLFVISDCMKIAVIRIVFPAHWQECYIFVGACPGEEKRYRRNRNKRQRVESELYTESLKSRVFLICDNRVSMTTIEALRLQIDILQLERQQFECKNSKV